MSASERVVSSPFAVAGEQWDFFQGAIHPGLRQMSKMGQTDCVLAVPFSLHLL